MLKSFKHKGLSELASTGTTGKIDAKMHARILVRLDRLAAITSLSQLNVPGFDFHQLKGFNPARYTIHINGPWCITFEFDGRDVEAIDLEQYH